MLNLPIEQRYSKQNRMFHSSGFAIAAGVVGVGAAAGSAAISMNAASRAAKGQAAAGKKYQRQIKKATKQFQKNQQQLREQIEAIDPTINIPPYDLRGATLEGIETANQITANTLQNLKSFGIDENTLASAGQLIQQRLSGQPLSQQDIGEIQRLTAMGEGAASYNPATAGAGIVPQRGTFDYARALGTRMSDVRTQGFNMAMSWGDFANRFIQSPTQMMQLGLMGRGQDIDVAQANVANQFRKVGALSGINEQMYAAQTGQAQAGYQVGQENIAANLASQQAMAQGVQSIGSATAGALGGIGSAYGQLAMARGGGTQYGSMAAAQQAAPFAGSISNVYGMGYVPRATAV